MKKKTINTLLKMENELELNKKCLFGFHFWQYYRVCFFNKIKFKLDGLEEGTNSYGSKVDKLKRMLLVNTKNKYRINSKIRKADYVFLYNPRRILINDKYVCPYLGNISDCVEGTKLFFEPLFYSHNVPTKESETIYLDKEYLNKNLYYRIHKYDSCRKSFFAEITAYLSKIELYLKKSEIDYHIDFEKEKRYLWRIYLEYRYMKGVFYKILSKVSPKAIFETCYYSFETMIMNEVSAELGIKTIEFQHGLISSEHFAYNSFDVLDNNTIPNYLFTFGEYWNSVSNFPIKKEHVIPFGFDYYENHKKKAKPIKCFNEKKNIVFISQWTIGGRLSKLALETSLKLDKNYHIIYKLHPEEYKDYNKKYKDIINNDKITLVTNEYNIYDLFASSFALVGVGSTSIFEGLGFGLQCFLYNIPGVEHALDLVGFKCAKLVNTSDEIIKNISTDFHENFQSEKIWKTCSVRTINDILKDIDKGDL